MIAMSNSKPKNAVDLERLKAEFKELDISLSKALWFNHPLQHYQGFWCPTIVLENIKAKEGTKSTCKKVGRFYRLSIFRGGRQ